MLFEHNKEVFENMESLLLKKGSCCVVMGTGVGKTYVASEFLDKYHYRALVVSPRNSINESWKKHSPRVETITYQKLANVFENIDFSKFNIVICDEVHHIGAPKWGKAIKHLIDNKIIKVLGLTESSIRYSDGGRDVAEDFFNGNIAIGVDVPTAIEQKILNPVTYVGAMYNSEGLKKTLRGKIQSRLYAKLNLVLNNTPTVQEIIKKHMPNGKRKGIIFASTIDDMKYASDFVHSIYPNVEIRFVHSKQSSTYNDANMEWFKNVDEGYLCSVDMISEGVHIKGVNTLIMLRRTESVNLFNQQLGRCLDASSREPAILFDLVNNQYSIHITHNRVQIKVNSIKDSAKRNVVASEQMIVKDYTKDIVKVLKEIKESLSKKWSEEEIQKLKDFMASGRKGIREWAKENLPDRTYVSVWSMICQLGLACHNHYWTKEEIEILKKYYPYGIDVAMEKLGNKLTAQQIKDKAFHLKIRNLYKWELEWPEEERKILIDNYPTSGVAGVKKLLPNKTSRQIKDMAHRLILKVNYDYERKWTEEEDELIRKLYPSCGYNIPNLNRTRMAIQRRAKILGVKALRIGRYGKAKKVLCVETNAVYESAKDAAKKTKISSKGIQRCCQGVKGRKTCGGYHWRYVENKSAKTQED